MWFGICFAQTMARHIIKCCWLLRLFCCSSPLAKQFADGHNDDFHCQRYHRNYITDAINVLLALCISHGRIFVVASFIQFSKWWGCCQIFIIKTARHETTIEWKKKFPLGNGCRIFVEMAIRKNVWKIVFSSLFIWFIYDFKIVNTLYEILNIFWHWYRISIIERKCRWHKQLPLWW